MKVLQLHNFYQQPGGEDQVFYAEGDLLEKQGHEVLRFTRHNDEVNGLSRLTLARAALWNGSIYRELRELLGRQRPAVAHFHNTFPLISPAAYYAAQAEGVPVVQTLHNYRLICPNGIFFREGRVCEACLGDSVPWPGVTHACYRGSRAATGVVAAILGLHRLLKTWQKTVAVYIAMTEFGRRKYVEAGLPVDRIVVKPHFVPDPGVGDGSGGYVLFVGRLTPEKGIETLLRAWKVLGGRVPLKVVGDGPLAAMVADEAKACPSVEWLGHVTPQQVYRLMARAACLILPSEWFETFGRVAVEAFAVGTPVVSANIGAIAELVEEGHTGLHFRPGDPSDLAAKVDQLLSSPVSLAAMRAEARRTYETRYTPEVNYRMTLEIYTRAMEAWTCDSGAP